VRRFSRDDEDREVEESPQAKEEGSVRMVIRGLGGSHVNGTHRANTQDRLVKDIPHGPPESTRTSLLLRAAWTEDRDEPDAWGPHTSVTTRAGNGSWAVREYRESGLKEASRPK
jgi:hypothetical protein